MDRIVGGRKCLYAARFPVSQIPLEIYLGHDPSPPTHQRKHVMGSLSLMEKSRLIFTVRW
jgi:hypothetical protein